MPSIGRVTKQSDGGYKGNLNTLTVNAPVTFWPVADKANKKQPDFVIKSAGVEIGAAWNKKNKDTGNDYVSCSFAAPEFGNQTLYANLGVEAGQDDEDVFAIIWNPKD